VGDDISCAVALLLEKEMYQADLNMEDKLQRVYIEPEALPALSNSSDENTDRNKELDSEYESKQNSDMDMHMQDDVNTPDGI
jgi:hypothetical protein